MTSLQELRNQIDTVDRSLIQELSQGGSDEDSLDEVVELTREEKVMLHSTRLRFSQRVCQLLQERMHISRNIGRIKREDGTTNMLDEERKKIMIDSRV